MVLIIRYIVSVLTTKNTASHVIRSGPVSLAGHVRTFGFYVPCQAGAKLCTVT